MPEGQIPPPCDPEIFKQGKSLLAVDTSDCRSWGFEPWVREIARKSGQRVDWHYSGGVAHVLYLGDWDKILKAILETPCPGRIMRYFSEGEGLWRNFQPAPEGTIGAFYDGGSSSQFLIGETNEDSEEA